MSSPVLLPRKDGRPFDPEILDNLSRSVLELRTDPSVSVSAAPNGGLGMDFRFLPSQQQIDDYIASDAPSIFDERTIGRFLASELYADIANFNYELCPDGEPPYAYTPAELIHLTSLTIPTILRANISGTRNHKCPVHNPKARTINVSPEYQMQCLGAVWVEQNKQWTIDSRIPVSLFEMVFSAQRLVIEEEVDFTLAELVNLCSLAIEAEVERPHHRTGYSMSYFYKAHQQEADLSAICEIVSEGLALAWFFLAGYGSQGSSMKGSLPAIKAIHADLDVYEVLSWLRRERLKNIRTMGGFYKQGIDFDMAEQFVGIVTPAALKKALVNGVDPEMLLAVHSSAA